MLLGVSGRLALAKRWGARAATGAGALCVPWRQTPESKQPSPQGVHPWPWHPPGDLALQLRGDGEWELPGA